MIFRYKIKFISDIEQKIRKLLVNIAVTPFVGVWIEIELSNFSSRSNSSLPSWECGLKCKWKWKINASFLSLPSWECGLKYVKHESDWGQNKVTPFVGVWIEISYGLRIP